MQLSNTPGKLVLPFANAGAKNTIPTASQIGVTAGAASLVDGFPPLTRTPIAAGGVPPSGLDMNGILFELSAILRWTNAGGGYAFDSTFATDSNVGGYPKGARVMRSDGLGYWFNTVENNTTNPEGAGAVAAGWVPDFTNGVAAVTMTGSNVTLTALEYGKPIIVISGLLTANLNLIFPSIAGEWSVINNTTGAYSVTCKTAAGTGVVVNSAQAIVGDGTNIYLVNVNSAPAGTLIMFAGAAAPAGYLVVPTSLTNVSRTAYAALFAAIGTTWGIGDGSTTFGLPWVPADYSIVQASANVGSSSVGAVIAHTHTYVSMSLPGTTASAGSTGGAAGGVTSSTGGAANLAAGVRMLLCIKY